MIGQIHFNREFTLGCTPIHNRQKIDQNVSEYNLVNSPQSSQDEVKNPRTMPRYGLQGISSKGKRKLRNAAAILEKKYGKSRLTFATVTIPTLSKSNLDYLNQNWGEFCRQWQQEIRREATRNNREDLQIVIVTEIQEKRLEKYDQVYLHLHAIWLGRPEGNYKYYVTADKVRSITARVIKVLLKQQKDYVEEEDFKTPRIELKQVKKSVQRYLAKYMSKGGKSLQKVKEKGLENNLPRQWWNMTRKLSKIVEHAKKKLDCTLSDFLMDNYQELIKNKILEYFYPVQIEIEEEQRIMGGVGKISTFGIKHLNLSIDYKILNELSN